MRRGSIVGPLLLIAVGGLFLANNLTPDLNFFELIAQYWPFLLIAWGVLRLIEIAIWRAGRKALPQSGISGGEWVLIVFLCLIGSGMFVIHRHLGWTPMREWRIHGVEMFGEPYDYHLADQKVDAVGKTPRVVIENGRGSVRVTGADETAVLISGRKTVRAFKREDADLTDRNTPLEVTRDGDAVVIRTRQEREAHSTRLYADLEVTVPRGANIEFRGREGDLDVTDLAGNVDARSDNAAIRVQNIGGSIRADVQKSDIVRAVNVKGLVDIKGRADNVEMENVEGDVTINGSYFEVQLRRLARPVKFEGLQTQFRVERCPGEIRMSPNNFTAENVIGPLHLTTTRSKDVQITDATDLVDVQLQRGDIELQATHLPLPKMELRTQNGDVTIGLPQEAKFSLKANTNHGEVHNEYGATIDVKDQDDNGSMTASSAEWPGDRAVHESRRRDGAEDFRYGDGESFDRMAERRDADASQTAEASEVGPEDPEELGFAPHYLDRACM